MVKIKHISHACFLIKNNEETLLIDPYDNSIGYDSVVETVNYILVSHNHYDHNYIENIEVEDNIGTFKIRKVNSFHDNQKGKLRGGNIIHVIETEGITLCHLGDLGHILTDEQIKEIGTVDILMIPVGGTYTIDYTQAIEVVEQIKANIIIPMHYKTGTCSLDIDTKDNFVNEIQKRYKVIKVEKNEIDYARQNENTVYII